MQNLRLPADEGRKVGAAAAASTFFDATRRCQNKIDITNRVPSHSTKLDEKLKSHAAGMEQMNLKFWDSKIK
jgi:hypothetical protein